MTANSRWSWIAALGLGCLAQLLLWSISEPAYLFSDFYKAYYPVADHLWFDGPRVPLPPSEAVVVGFVNLPIVGWLFVPLLAFGEDGSSWAWLAVGAVVCVLAWHLLVRRIAPGHGALLLLLFLLNGPLVNSLREGNSTHLVLLLAVLGLVAWRSDRKALAGVLLALCGVIKLPLLLLGVYFVLRGQWRVVAGGAATVLLLAVSSLAIHGLDANLDWYRQSVEPFLGGVIPAFNVQSIDGFLMRLTTGTAALNDWTPHTPTLAHKIVRSTIVALLLAGTAWLVLRRRSAAGSTAEPGDRDLLEIGLVLTLALLISPLCWSHYYLLMLLPAAIWLGTGDRRPHEAGWRFAFWIGYACTSLPIVMVPLAADELGEILARTAISLWLLGGLLMLAAQARALWRNAEPVAANGPTARAPDAAPITFGLAALFIAGVLGLNLLLANGAPTGYRETALQQTGQMLAGEGGDDSWGVMHVALQQFAYMPGAPLYSELFFQRLYRFQYPPSSLFALMGLRLAGPENVRVADGVSFAVPPVNDIIAWLFLALTAAAAAAIVELRLRRMRGLADYPVQMVLRTLLVCALTWTFYPLVKAYTLGQIQVWINGAFALALLCWVRQRTGLAGLLIGLTCLIKPQYGLLLPWALLRREWAFAGGVAATAAIGLVSSIAVFGWSNHVDYLRVLQFLSQHGEAYFPNQSVNGLANRLMALADPQSYIVLDIPAGKFPPYTPIVYGATLVSSVILVLYGFLRRDPGDPPRDFARMALCCTMASPIAWEHHYGILLPIFALLLADRITSVWRLAALIVAYLLAANFFPVLNLLADTALNPVISYVLLAAFLVLALLHRRAADDRLVMNGAVIGR